MEQRFTPEEAVETEEANPKVLDFFVLSEQETIFLCEQIARNNGLIRVFVHPYFEEIESGSENRIKRKRLIDEAIKKILLLDPDLAPPIIIMEEQTKVEELKEKICAENAANKVYIVRTYDNSPEPKKDITSRNEFSNREGENWAEFIDQLKVLGVKSIFIGGQQFRAYKNDESDSKIQLMGCVGDAIEHLKSEFNVKLSDLSSPHGLSEYEYLKSRE